MTELRKAFKAERQIGKRKLFPVRLVDVATLRDWECFDTDSGRGPAVVLPEYFIADVSFEADKTGTLVELRSLRKTLTPPRRY